MRIFSEIVRSIKPLNNRLRFIIIFLCFYAVWPAKITNNAIFVIAGLKIFIADFLFIITVYTVLVHYRKIVGEKKNFLLTLMWLCIFFGIFSSIYSFPANGVSAFGEVARQIYYIVFIGVFVYMSIKEIDDVSHFLLALCLPGVLASFSTVLDVISFKLYGITMFTHFDSDWVRFSNAASSLFILFSLITLLHRIIIEKSKSRGIYFLSATLFFALVIGQARTLWVAAAFSIPLLFILKSKSLWSLIKSNWLSITLLLIFIPFFYDFLTSIQNEGAARSVSFLSGLENDQDWVWRLLVWEQIFDQANQHWILGLGLGAKYDYDIPGGIWDEEYLPPPHNGWLASYYQQGILGPLLVFAVFINTFTFLYKIIKTNKDNPVILSMTSTLFIFNFVQFLYFIPYGATLFTFIVPGITAKISFLIKQSSQSKM